MIKVYGIESENYDICDREEIYNYFLYKDYIEVDTETTGFDAISSQIICLQLGDYDNQFVISGTLIGEFQELLESKLLLLQNAKFDLKFLYVHDIFPNQVYDTFLAEGLITCGLKQAKRGLKAIAKDRLNIDLDKEIRDNIGKEGLTKRVIEYSANDVKYLNKIKESQAVDIKRLDLQDAVDMENEFVKVLAYIEICGFKLNKKSWEKKMEGDIKRLQTAEKELDEYLINNNIKEFISLQMDLFSEEKSTTINWSSSKQVVELFKKLKIPTSIVDKGEKKDSVEAKHIEKYVIEFPFVAKYLKYKEEEKVVSTYGKGFIKQIHPITGRIHTNFRQIMDTGRISSGGKNKMTKEEYINFQNIPSDDRTRSCFTCEEGNTLIVSDYSGQEQIVLANKCLDKNILKFYDEGMADMHAFVAQGMYPELAELSLEEIKAKHKDKRQEAKIAGFVINYGGAPNNIAEQLNKTKEVGERVFAAYFKVFPGLKSYFEEKKQEGLKNGYILVSKESGRKAFIDGYEEYLELQKEINRDFWDRWKVVKNIFQREGGFPEYITMKEKISKFFKIKGAIERKSLNFPIQGSSAEITKLAGIYFFNWIKQNKLLNIVLIPNTVHDEFVIECPEIMAEEISCKLKELMEKAGDVYCKRVKLKAETKISKIWQK